MVYRTDDAMKNAKLVSRKKP